MSRYVKRSRDVKMRRDIEWRRDVKRSRDVNSYSAKYDPRNFEDTLS